MSGPLAGVQVLSFGRALAGPYAAMLLADLGAEVIKIEEPGDGDQARTMGPFHRGLSSYFLSNNRGKKSISLNLRNEKAREVVRGPLPAMDVLERRKEVIATRHLCSEFSEPASVFWVGSQRIPAILDVAKTGPG